MAPACQIWHTPATMPRDSDGGSLYFDSPRAGGRYRITPSASATIGNLGSQERALLTTWLCNQRRAGIEFPTVTSNIIATVGSFRALTITERIERTLLYLSQRLRVGQPLVIIMGDFRDKEDNDAYHLAALTESLTKNEVVSSLKLLEDMRWLDARANGGRFEFMLAAAGWLKIDELRSRQTNSSQAFVAMWFNSITEAAYRDGIEPAITQSGYRAVRIDKKEHVNKVDDEIVAEIRRSKFLVADFTCEKEKVRGGVYFEAGFAMALPIPVIWTCSTESITDLHFDTRQYNHIVWDTPEKLRELLKARVGAVIGDGPLRGT